MPVIDETVVIARSVDEVFDFLIIATNLPRWDSSMLECVQVGGGAVTAGTRYRGASKILAGASNGQPRWSSSCRVCARRASPWRGR